MDQALPAPFIERLRKIIPPDRYPDVLASFSLHRPLSVRINPLKTTPENAMRFFRDSGIPYETVSWNPHAFILPSSRSKDITGLEAYGKGEFFIQSLSSMIPSLALGPKPGERVLDMAASPGAKTTQIASLMDNTGQIIANDIDRKRLFKLRAVLDSQGVSNTKTSSMPGQSLWKKYPEYFDRVLLDAPCSMEGRFSTEDPSSYDHWSVKKVRNLGKLQKWMLRSAVSCTKPGGIIVYSTCTLSPEENEEVIDWILEKEKGKIEIEHINIPGTQLAQGLVHYGEKRFSPDIARTVRIAPSALMEGFFIARLKKVANNVHL